MEASTTYGRECGFVLVGFAISILFHSIYLGVIAGVGGLVLLVIDRTNRRKPITRLGLSDLTVGDLRRYRENAAPNADFRALTRQALTEVRMACYGWKNAYFALCPEILTEPDSAEDRDAWDMLRRTPSHQYSESAWTRYLPLFTVAANTVITRLAEVESTKGDVLPAPVRTLIATTKMQLKADQGAYRILPSLFHENPHGAFDTSESRDRAFVRPFNAMVQILAELSRQADRENEMRKTSHNHQIHQ
jgi:hypothetical protein